MKKQSEDTMSRGSQWCRWEPHIHTPGTIKADNYRGTDVWEKYLVALESETPCLSAIGVTDYGVTASYERVKAEKESGRLKDCELLFPNIELRLDHGTVKGNFVNAHLLVSPEDPKHVQELNRFLGRLKFTAHGDTFVCTPADLMRLGRRSDPAKTTDASALEHGYTQFKITLRQLLDVYRDIRWAQENILIAVAGGADGTSGLKEAADATLREEIEKAAHIVFSGSPKDRDFWLGRNSVASVAEICARYGSLKPCLWGCDAHEMAKVGKPELDRLCWLKGKPTFDALRQAVIDPERAYVGETPPGGAMSSQTIENISIAGAPWIKTPQIPLNQGLVAVIGARGSGKTALADIIATGCDAYTGSQARPSFLARASEFLGGASVTMVWGDDQDSYARPLDRPINESADAYPRARYLSQQFVEDLCSIEGMPKLVKEIERVIFEANPEIERDGTLDFNELLALRAGEHRQARFREESALMNLSDQIGIEMDKSNEVAPLKLQIAAKEKHLIGYQRDRKLLLPKIPSKASDRLQELTEATEKVRGYIRFYANQQATLTGIKGEVQDFRENRAPDALRNMKENNKLSGLKPPDWEQFLLTYSGDVDGMVVLQIAETEKRASQWKGTTPTTPVDETGAFVGDTAQLEKTPLAVLQAEISRLGGILLADQEAAKKLAAISKRIAEETAELDKLKTRLEDCEGARERAKTLVEDRDRGYLRVFDAVLAEETVLNELYAPLMDKLKVAGGTLGKLSFTVTRVANVKKWAAQAEGDLFDLRGGPFKGIGSLELVANAELASVWESGSASEVSEAMAAFQKTHTSALIEKANIKRDDPALYRPWSRRFAQWLYSTKHISIEYGIQYDGIAIEKLSPGTRGIVLVLLYLALDDGDDRPLIIDQPEENLDPKSIYAELVPLFQSAKQKRQIIMVTHNANLVINADADQIIVADVGAHLSIGLPPITYMSGGLEEAHIRELVCDILEGGEIAFQDRARRLRIDLIR
jgi:hypothetical protein